MRRGPRLSQIRRKAKEKGAKPLSHYLAAHPGSVKILEGEPDYVQNVTGEDPNSIKRIYDARRNYHRIHAEQEARKVPNWVVKLLEAWHKVKNWFLSWRRDA